jgi:hypothetical protein
MNIAAAEAAREALEATTVTPRSGGFDTPASANASRRSILAHRDSLLRFLGELDGDMTVSELREALEDYS